MTLEVKVKQAKTHPSELPPNVEAGEDGVISRGNEPTAPLVPVENREDRIALIEAMRRVRALCKRVTLEEIFEFRDEGRR